jgi:hypothetical protein
VQTVSAHKSDIAVYQNYVSVLFTTTLGSGQPAISQPASRTHVNANPESADTVWALVSVSWGEGPLFWVVN